MRSIRWAPATWDRSVRDEQLICFALRRIGEGAVALSCSEKLQAARLWDRSVCVVRAEWLLECLRQWRHVEEEPYLWKNSEEGEKHGMEIEREYEDEGRRVDQENQPVKEDDIETGDEEDNIETGDEEDNIETGDEEDDIETGDEDKIETGDEEDEKTDGNHNIENEESKEALDGNHNIENEESKEALDGNHNSNKQEHEADMFNEERPSEGSHPNNEESTTCPQGIESHSCSNQQEQSEAELPSTSSNNQTAPASAQLPEVFSSISSIKRTDSSLASQPKIPNSQ